MFACAQHKAPNKVLLFAFKVVGIQLDAIEVLRSIQILNGSNYIFNFRVILCLPWLYIILPLLVNSKGNNSIFTQFCTLFGFNNVPECMSCVRECVCVGLAFPCDA